MLEVMITMATANMALIKNKLMNRLDQLVNFDITPAVQSRDASRVEGAYLT